MFACIDCFQQLQATAHSMDKFRKIETFWKEFLTGKNNWDKSKSFDDDYDEEPASQLHFIDFASTSIDPAPTTDDETETLPIKGNWEIKKEFKC